MLRRALALLLVCGLAVTASSRTTARADNRAILKAAYKKAVRVAERRLEEAGVDARVKQQGLFDRPSMRIRVDRGSDRKLAFRALKGKRARPQHTLHSKALWGEVKKIPFLIGTKKDFKGEDYDWAD